MSFDVTVNPRQPREKLIREMTDGGVPNRIAEANADLCIARVEANPDSEEKLRFESRNTVIDARQPDATTCPGCRVAVPLGQFCKCPMRWKG